MHLDGSFCSEVTNGLQEFMHICFMIFRSLPPIIWSERVWFTISCRTKLKSFNWREQIRNLFTVVTYSTDFPFTILWDMSWHNTILCLSQLQDRSTYDSTWEMHLMSSVLVWIKMRRCTQESLKLRTLLVWEESTQALQVMEKGFQTLWGLYTFPPLTRHVCRNSGRSTAPLTSLSLEVRGWTVQGREPGWELQVSGEGRPGRVTKTCLSVEVTRPRLATVARTLQTQRVWPMSHATVLLRFQPCTVTMAIISSTRTTTTQCLLPLHTTGVGTGTAPATPKKGRWKDRLEGTQPPRLLPSLRLPAPPQRPPPLPGRPFGSWTARGGLCAAFVASTAVCFSWTMSCLLSIWAATVFASLSSVTSVATAARTATNFLLTSSAENTSLNEDKGLTTCFPLKLFLHWDKDLAGFGLHTR